MATKRPSRSTKKPVQTSLVVRLDQESKTLLKEAAAVRKLSVSDYVRNVTVAQARRDVQGVDHREIILSPEDQLALWNALEETPVLTEAERELGAIMRGEK